MRNLMTLLRYLKAKSLFNKNSTHGKLLLDSKSRCYSDHKGNIVIGDSSEILCTIVSQENGKLTIGHHTTIRSNGLIGCVNSITIGNNCIISNNVHIYDNNNHPTSPEIRKQMTNKSFYGEEWRWLHSDSKPIIIEDNVWIGERVTILKGVHIGEGSIIGCDSVVTHDVPPYSVAAGNPAKIVKKLR